MNIDCITFHNEADLFDLRYNILKDVVDEFIVVESTTTFAGHDKELTFPTSKYPKVRYHVNQDNYTQEEIEQARNSSNTGGYERWMHEFLQKERIKQALTHLQDDDMVFIGDVDEIVEPIFYVTPPNKLTKFKLRVYSYYLNLRSDEQFWGPICAKYSEIKNECLNHLRNSHETKNTINYSGWHFTNQGGLDAVRKKVYDQYNPDVFGNQTYYNLEDRFGKIDFIGRNFKLEVDEKDWPTYLKENREKYIHLLK